MSARKLFLFVCFCSSVLLVSARKNGEIPPNKVIPSENQVRYQQQEIVGFIHFTITTWYNREWGLGDEDIIRFNPSKLDAEQWVRTAKAGGIRELILTAKHHDGFCLWPSQYTKHSLKYSPYKNGKGDIVKEFTDACHKYGIKVGLYLSPWDRNHKDYGRPEYITYFKNQLTELLSNYGKINEIWFDGANGGDGYYGGAREKRKIANDYYPWAEIRDIVKRLQPDCMMFSDAGPDIRWVGNEDGVCGETFWSTIDDSRLVPGKSDRKYLNVGAPNGSKWLIGQCDVSIRPGWFYHSAEDSQVKTPRQLTDLYYKSVGRNGVLLINLPPDTTGLISKIDSVNLVAFKRTIDNTFRTNLALKTKVKASSVWSKRSAFAPGNIVDGDFNSFWAALPGTTSAQIDIDLRKNTTFDRLLLQEPIRFGQRVSSFEVSALIAGEWKLLAKATTIGYKRLLRFDKVNASALRIQILSAVNTPAISEVGLYLSAEAE